MNFSLFRPLLAFSFVFSVLCLFVTPHASAETVSSNCVVTKVGNPLTQPSLPPECAGANGPVAQKAIQYARDQIPRSTYVFNKPSRAWQSTGKPGTNAPIIYDCSGLVGWAYYWASEGKVYMIGTTYVDWDAAKPGGRNNAKYKQFFAHQKNLIQPGDIVYFAGSRGSMSELRPGHVGIYAGPGQGACAGKTDCYVHISTTGRPPKEESLGTKKDFIGFLRPVLN